MAVTEPDFLRDTRASYDAVATGYAERFRDELAAKPLDLAMLAGLLSWCGPLVLGRSPISGVVLAGRRHT